MTIQIFSLTGEVLASSLDASTRLCISIFQPYSDIYAGSPCCAGPMGMRMREL